MRLLLQRYKDCQKGATAVEYAMLLALFSFGIMVWGARTGQDLDQEMVAIAQAIDETPGGDSALSGD